MKCLMVETQDRRRFFTLVGNQKMLREYCRAFGAKMFVVKAEIEKSKVLDINRLVPALCDKNHKNEKVTYEIVKNNYPK